MAGSGVEQARARAVARHRAVTKKISRLNRGVGAEISGTQFDPRGSLSDVRKMTSRQANAYIKKMDRFVDRKTQFVPDSQHRPMPMRNWLSYKDAEKAMNKIIQTEKKQFGKLKLPNGLTSEQARAMTQTIHPHMHNPATNSMQKELDRKSKTAKDLRALDKLTMAMRNRATPKHRAEMERADRIATDKMLRAIGDDALANKVQKLSSAKFRFMFGHSEGFANDLSLDYEAWKKLMLAEKNGTTPGRDTVELESKKGVKANDFVKWLEEQAPEQYGRSAVSDATIGKWYADNASKLSAQYRQTGGKQG